VKHKQDSSEKINKQALKSQVPIIPY